MPIPFQDQNTISSSTVGYLKFLPHTAKSIWLGALFIMNARGEPVEFTHASVRSPNPVLWRIDDLRTCCQESLCNSIFEVCPVVPDLFLCLAEDVDIRLFDERVSLEIAVGRVAHDASGGDISTEWSMDSAPLSPLDKLYENICSRGLLLEPFARAEVGLREVYSDLLR